MEGDKWPGHKAQKRHRAKRWDIWKNFGITDSTLKEYGTPKRFFDAQEVVGKYYELVAEGEIDEEKDIWLGGCEEPTASLDIVLKKIPSISNPGKYHKIFGKFTRPKDEIKNEIADIDVYFLDSYPVKHVCESSGYGMIQHIPGPDKHEIAYYLIVQMESAIWCNKKGGNYAGKFIWPKYERNPEVFYIFEKPPKDAMRMFNMLNNEYKRGTMTALTLDKMLMNFLKEKHEKYWTPERRRKWYDKRIEKWKELVSSS